MLREYQISLKKFVIHEREKANIHITHEDDKTCILGNINKNLILHSNIDKYHVKPMSSNFTVAFSVKGKFDLLRFRVTTADPAEDYEDIIVYPGDVMQNAVLSIKNFSLNNVIVFDFNIYGNDINLIISNVTLTFNNDRQPQNLQPAFVAKYAKNALVRDYKMLFAPEPHSQERAAAIYPFLNLDNSKTIDLGAGGAPMMSDLLLRKGIGEVDCLVYDAHDVRRAKRLLDGYEGRVAIFKGDITDGNTIPCKQYDQILLLDILEHIEDDKKALLNIKKLFEKNSIMICTVPNVNYKKIMSEEFHRYVGHVRDGYTREAMIQLLSQCGFAVIESFNFSHSNMQVYEWWYKDIKAWRNTFQYSEAGYNFITENFRIEKAFYHGDNDEGISNCFICKFK